MRDYHRQAEACMAKVGQTRDEAIRSQYMRLAETYLQMVQMELRRAELRARIQSGES
jgi:hypothetical protein